jgi:hypothetical protein
LAKAQVQHIQFVTEQMIKKIESALITKPVELMYSYRPVALDQKIREARDLHNAFLDELNLPLLP